MSRENTTKFATGADTFRLRRETWEAIRRALTPQQRKSFDEWHGRMDVLSRAINEDLAPGEEILPWTRERIGKLLEMVDEIPWMRANAWPQSRPS